MRGLQHRQDPLYESKRPEKRMEEIRAVCGAYIKKASAAADEKTVGKQSSFDMDGLMFDTERSDTKIVGRPLENRWDIRISESISIIRLG